jgi:phage/plasmid primase-like uncharacterized protein
MWSSGSRAGACGLLGEPTGPIHVREGFADAVAVAQLATMGCHDAGSTANLRAAVAAIRKKYPGAKIILSADKDESGREAGQHLNVQAVCPPAPDKDFDAALEAGVSEADPLAPWTSISPQTRCGSG